LAAFGCLGVLSGTEQEERNMKKTLNAALCLMLLVGTVELSAQSSHTREGFWGGFGFGRASVSGGCDDISSGAEFCDAAGEKQGAFAVYLMMGSTLSPHLRLGAEAYSFIGLRDFAGGTVYDENTLTVGISLAPALYYYPMVERGLFVKGGVGMAWYVEAEYEGRVDWSSSGLGFLFGAGYDLRIGSNTSLTPLFTFGWGGGGDLILNNPESEGIPVGQNWSHTYFSLAMGFTFH
jgi:hypothetical protein